MLGIELWFSYPFFLQRRSLVGIAAYIQKERDLNLNLNLNLFIAHDISAAKGTYSNKELWDPGSGSVWYQ